MLVDVKGCVHDQLFVVTNGAIVLSEGNLC